MASSSEAGYPRGRVAEVAVAFLRLGATAFGGPLAHLGLMREELVRRRSWVDEATFVDFLSLANLLPGPTSTEVAMQLGRARAGRNWREVVLLHSLLQVRRLLLERPHRLSPAPGQRNARGARAGGDRGEGARADRQDGRAGLDGADQQHFCPK